MFTKIIVNGAAVSTEVLPYSHRLVLKRVQRMINQNRFVNDGEILHELLSFRHPRANATFLKVRLDNKDIITIAVLTEPSAR